MPPSEDLAGSSCLDSDFGLLLGLFLLRLRLRLRLGLFLVLFVLSLGLGLFFGVVLCAGFGLRLFLLGLVSGLVGLIRLVTGVVRVVGVIGSVGGIADHAELGADLDGLVLLGLDLQQRAGER